MEWPLVGRKAALDQAVELIESSRGVALLGPAGVGKSRLLHELADGVGAGWTVVNTVASVSTRSVPFSAFVDLLPGGPTPDRLVMLGAAREDLVSRVGSRGLLLTVDDAHHLDELSLAFLVSVVSSGIAAVALTARIGEPMPPDLVDLWTNGVMSRLDIEPLNRQDAAHLVAERLGETTAELEQELWNLAAGNPLVLHELIEGAVDRAIVKDESGVWISNGPLAESARLSDLVHSRLDSLPVDLRQAMDMVAVGGSVPWAIAEAAFGDTLPILEQRRLVSVSGSGEEARVVPAHPLYGEILGSHIGEARTRSAFKTLVEAATVATGSPIDPLQVALWQRDCGELISSELAIAGAQEALIRHRPQLVEDLLRPLGTDDDLVAVLMGRSLNYRQKFEEAEALLEGRHPADPALVGELASIRAHNLAFGLRRLDEARSVLSEAAELIADPDLKARLMNERALVSAIHGDFHDSEVASGAVLADPGTSAVSRAAAYVTLTVALSMTGDCDGLNALFDDALLVAAEAREVLPLAADQIGVMGMISKVSAGRIAEALDRCTGALAESERGLTAKTTWMSGSVMVMLIAGQLAEAKALALRALDSYAEADPFGLEAQTRGLVGIVAGMTGESVADDFLELHTTQAGARITAWLARGRAWSAAARGDLSSAVRHASEGGREAVAHQHFAWAMLCFVDAVRFGDADSVLTDMQTIDTSRGAHLLAAMQGHAAALSARVAPDLDRVGLAYVAFGCWPLAADAFAQASVLWNDQGASVAAALSGARSMTAQSRCSGLATPAIERRPRLVTERELEVALDAARGLSSPQISQNRFISVRTVDNHLSSVYRKLGLSGREELAAAFGEMSSSAGSVE